MNAPERTLGQVAGAPVAHDSAQLHVTGQARYTDDIPEPSGTLHAAMGLTASLPASTGRGWKRIRA